jgi:hypothetical protein
MPAMVRLETSKIGNKGGEHHQAQHGRCSLSRIAILELCSTSHDRAFLGSIDD